MCEPTTIMMGVGLVMGAVGQVQQGKQAKATAKYNAAIESQRAADTEERGRNEEARIRREGEGAKGRQIAQLAANGIEISTGSASDLIADTAMMTELDALTVRSNTEREAAGLRSSSESLLAQGSNAQSNANFGAAGSLISGAASVNSQWTKYNANKTTTETKTVT